MGKQEPLIRTRRLLLRPMSDLEIEQRMAAADSEELRAAYGEMLSACRGDPENRVWYAPWEMTLKGEHTAVGDLGFKGPAHENAVEIGYGLLPEQQGKGYATEAVQAMTQWAFSQSGVACIQAETEPGNKDSRRVLEKCGFTPDGEGKEGPRFVLEAPLTNWMTSCMLFGLSIGTALGASFGSMGLGMSMGLCFGLCIGVELDLSAKKERKKRREARSSHK